jgi:hypothetical protein
LVGRHQHPNPAQRHLSGHLRGGALTGWPFFNRATRICSPHPLFFGLGCTQSCCALCGCSFCRLGVAIHNPPPSLLSGLLDSPLGEVGEEESLGSGRTRTWRPLAQGAANEDRKEEMHQTNETKKRRKATGTLNTETHHVHLEQQTTAMPGALTTGRYGGALGPPAPTWPGGSISPLGLFPPTR